MGEPRVLVQARRNESRPLNAAPDFGWLLLGWVGAAFVLIGGLDVALTWYPTHVGSPEWEFGTVSASLDGLPVPAMGLALVVASGAARGIGWVVRGLALVFGVLALAIVVAGLLYATNVPIALQSVTDPVVRTGVTKAVAKTCAQAVVYPLAFAWIAVKGWKHAGSR